MSIVPCEYTIGTVPNSWHEHRFDSLQWTCIEYANMLPLFVFFLGICKWLMIVRALIEAREMLPVFSRRAKCVLLFSRLLV